MSDRFRLTAEEAVGVLPDGDRVHTQSMNGMIIGADWDREGVISHIEKHGASLAGPLATSMGHGLCLDAKRRLFCATDAKRLAALEAVIAAEVTS